MIRTFFFSARCWITTRRWPFCSSHVCLTPLQPTLLTNGHRSKGSTLFVSVVLTFVVVKGTPSPCTRCPKEWNVDAPCLRLYPLPHVLVFAFSTSPPCSYRRLRRSLYTSWGEQHGKGLDRLLGWGCAWIEAFLQDQPIYGLADLLRCYKAGAQDMVNTNPHGPRFNIQKFDPGTERPLPRMFFQCGNCLVTRTYCMKAGLRILDKTFGDNDGGTELHNWWLNERDIDNEGAPTSNTWRRGFWSGDRSWENEGPLPGTVNEVTRRHADQKHLQTPAPLPPSSSSQRGAQEATATPRSEGSFLILFRFRIFNIIVVVVCCIFCCLLTLVSLRKHVRRRRVGTEPPRRPAHMENARRVSTRSNGAPVCNPDTKNNPHLKHMRNHCFKHVFQCFTHFSRRLTHV